MAVHSVTRGWQDIRILLGVMGATQPPIPCPTEGSLVTSCRLSYCHFSKTYCRKPRSLPQRRASRSHKDGRGQGVATLLGSNTIQVAPSGLPSVTRSLVIAPLIGLIDFTTNRSFSLSVPPMKRW